MNLIPMLIPLVLPLLTGLVKKALKTDQIEDRKIKSGVNGLIPVAGGVASAFGLCYLGVDLPIEIEGARGWVSCLAAGLVLGTTSGFMRDQAQHVAVLVAKGAEKLAAKGRP